MAGTNAKDIRLRIRSVESTMQITKAMQLVAASKLQRARRRMLDSRPFGEVSAKAVSMAAGACKGDRIPYATPREVRKVCYVVMAGDRGLAGGYNNAVFKLQAAESEGKTWCVLPVGKKAVEKYRHIGAEVVNDAYIRVEGLSVSACYAMAREILAGYDAEQYDEVQLIYTDFHNMLDQAPKCVKLLPLEPAEEAPQDMVYDPSPEEVLQAAMPSYLSGCLYAAACDAFLSEVTARRGAMDNATRNAEGMISELNLRYNRARQGAITQEITEIIAGSEQ